MKVLGKKIYRGNVLLLTSYMAVSLCLLLIISAIRIEKINTISRNALYTDNKSNFLLSYAEEDAWEGVVPELMNEYDNFVIYYTIPDKDISMRGILVKGTVQEPPMLSGEYFDEETSWSNIRRVVVGKDIENDTYRKDEKTYYDYNGQTYEVIGIMGTEMDSRLNHTMIFDYKSAIIINGINGEYCFDSCKELNIPKEELS